MKKLGVGFLLLLLVSGALVCGLREPYRKLVREAGQRGLPALAWFEIRRDLNQCGSETTEKKCVVSGGGGWLFYHESLINLARPWSDNTPSIIAFKDSLAARGVLLVVVPVPDKLQVESSNYLRYSRADLVPKAYRAWVGRLQDAGVAVVDAMDAFKSKRDSVPMFEPFESHLTAAGRLLLAQAVSDTLARRITLPSERNHVLVDSMQKGSGNLFHLRYGHYNTYRVPEIMVKDRAGAKYVEKKKAPIVIIGDSNAGHGMPYASHIGALIAQTTGLDAFTISKVGAGNSGPRVFKGKERFLASKKVVVWVFDGRELYGDFGMPEF